MKVIDMLDRIAKGEEVKFKIIATCEVLNLTKDMHLFSITHDEPVNWFIDEEWLNYEVEIIEEDKKIEKIGNNNYKWNYVYDKKTPQAIVDNLELVREKINEIIDYLGEK